MKMKPRLDELLVERGLFPDVHSAQVAVLAGQVIVGEHRETSAGKRLSPDVTIRLKGQGRFVSRGGEKLQGALNAFGLDPSGLRCADLGASSGGFTDCLLQAGAEHVSSIDVNYGQFAWSLRNNPRVSLFERTNVRGIDPAAVEGPFDLVVGDLSFISIRGLMADFFNLLSPGGQLLMLVKPQFEVAKSEVGEGGIVRDPALHERVLCQVLDSAVSTGFEPLGLTNSPIKGPKGNIEFLLWARRPVHWAEDRSTIPSISAEAVVRDAHKALGGR